MQQCCGMCSPCLCILCQPVPPTHPYIWQISFGNLQISCIVSALFLHGATAAHALAVDVSSAHAHRQNGIQQLIYSAPTIEKCRSYVADTLKTKRKSTTSKEFPCYWWLFLTQHLSRYSARLVEERRKKERKMNNSDFRPFQVCYLKIVTTHCYYYYRLGQAL